MDPGNPDKKRLRREGEGEEGDQGGKLKQLQQECQALQQERQDLRRELQAVQMKHQALLVEYQALQQERQGQMVQQELQDHFFSGLVTKRNVWPVMAKILSHLSGRDVRNCLWTCKALRQAVMNDRGALQREMALAFELQSGNFRPRRVSGKFVTCFKEWNKQFDQERRYFESDNFKGNNTLDFMYFLALEVNDTQDNEADRVMSKLDMEILSEPEFPRFSGTPKFGKDWKGRIGQVVESCEQPDCTWLQNGNLVVVERQEKDTECWLVRLDDREENGGKIIDRWDHADFLDGDNRHLVMSCSKSWAEGQSRRRGNMVFCVYFKSFARNDDNSERKCNYNVGFMVNLYEDKLIWKKKIDSSEWRELFFTDRACGFLESSPGYSYNDDCPRTLRHFNAETGMEMTSEKPEELFALSQTTELGSGSNVVAMINGSCEHSHPKDLEGMFTGCCHLLDAWTGSALSRFCLMTPDGQEGEHFLEDVWEYCFVSVFNPLPFWFSLFGDHVLVMCETTIRGSSVSDRTTKTSFTFWDLSAPTRKGVKIGVPCAKDGEDFVCKQEEADVIMGKVVCLDGYESVGPSLTGNIWFLLSSKVVGKGQEEKVWHELHGVNLNRSVGTYWNSKEKPYTLPLT